MPRPFFQKLILPSTFKERRLRLPENFVKKVKDELSVAVALTVPDGHVWRVGLIKADNKVWFQEGWYEFMERYSIRTGYLLIFRYEGSSAFNVSIFNLPISEINYHSPSELFKQGKLYAFEELEDDDATPALQNFLTGPRISNCISWSDEGNLLTPKFEEPPKAKKPGRKRKSEAGSIKIGQQDRPAGTNGYEGEMRFRFYESASARKRTVTAEERERAINAAKVFEPSNPYCRVVLRPSYLYRGCIMYLPSCFAEKHLSGVSGFIQLQLSDGRQWPVRCLYKGGRAKFSQGWYEFTLENNLGEGDVCVFEMVNARELILKVTAFRVLDGH